MLYKDSLGNLFEELLFDKDWNWLMAVVDKIEDMDFNFSITTREAVALMPRNHSAIYLTNIYRKVKPTKMQATYKTCVEFIKWHNTQEISN